MYDLVPPNMKAQFNLINLSNQSIKLTVNVSNKVSNKKSLINYSYNKITIFKYNMYVGEFFISLVKFILSMLFAFYISRFLNDIIN